MGEYGNKETIEAVISVVALANAIDKSQEDGFQWPDIFALAPALLKMPKAIEGSGDIPAEVADLCADERAEIYVEIEKLGFASSFSEKIAEEALKVTLGLVRLGLLIGDGRN